MVDASRENSPWAPRSGTRCFRSPAMMPRVVAAIAAMTALVVAGTTMWATAWQDDYTPGRWMPTDAVAISTCTYPQAAESDSNMIDPPSLSCVTPSDALLASAHKALDEVMVVIPGDVQVLAIVGEHGYFLVKNARDQPL